MVLDYNTANRMIALGGLIAAAGYPTETWEDAWGLIRTFNQPEALEDVAIILDILKENKERIIAAHPYVDLDAPVVLTEAEANTDEPVAAPVKAKRG